MKVKVEIETVTFVRLLLIIVGFVAAILALFKLSSALTIILISAFLALALNPPVTRIAKRLPGGSRIGATAIAYVFVLTILGGFLYLAAPPVIQQTSNFIQSFPTYVDQVTSQQGVVSDFIDRYDLEEEVIQFSDNLRNQVGVVVGGVGGSVFVGVTSIFTGAITLIMLLVLTFLMLIEGPSWLNRVWALYTDPHQLERHHALVRRMYRVVTGYVNGQMLVAAIAATCTLVVVLILGSFFPEVPTSAALPLAGIIFLTGLIPMVGATIGAIIVTTVLLFNDVSAAVIFLIYFLVYQQIENNFIQPVVQARTVELTALSVFMAIIIGVTIFGIVGGIIAIPVAGCLRVLLLDQIAQRQKQRKKKPFGKLVKET